MCRFGLLSIAVALAGCGSRSVADWPLANGDLHSTRATDALEDAGSLQVAWRYRVRGATGDAGAITATPVVANSVVFLQDMSSTVTALDLATGVLRWRHRFHAPSPGPNGVAVASGRVFGATDATAFALSATTGKLIWRTLLATPKELFVDTAPQVDSGAVYFATVGVGTGGSGALYSLDARSGRMRWRRSTLRKRWAVPSEAAGGGAWYPPSIDGRTVYWGTANPLPFGGTRAHPNGGAYAGSALYTDTLLALDETSGRVDWFDQVTPHDIRDHDFQLPPILVDGEVVGAGKAGRVIAWDARNHRRIWETSVGLHRNDEGPLPRRRVSVCPGLLGGVETPMAAAAGRLFVPVVDLCSWGSAVGYQPVDRLDPRTGRGMLVALDLTTGRRLWARSLPQPDFGCATVAGGVVFTSTFDGTVYAFDAAHGRRLWVHRLRAGVNACPAVAGGMLLVPAGIPGRGAPELVAFRGMGNVSR